MPSSRERLLATLLHIAPLLGVGAQIAVMNSSHDWNFMLLFTLGAFMLLFGVVVAALSSLIFRTQAFLAHHARAAWHFQGILALIALGLGILVLAGSWLDSGVHNLQNPPKIFEAVLVFPTLYSALFLPIIECIRLIYAGTRAWRGQNIW